MLDNQQCTDSEIQNHPASRNQYPGSINTANGFHHKGLHPFHFAGGAGRYRGLQRGESEDAEKGIK